MSKRVKAVEMPNKYNRYMLIDIATGEIVDDAQGYGYRTKQKAHAAWNYQHATSKQKRARKQNRKRNEEFLKQHKHFEDAWGEVCLECYKDGEEPSYDDFKMLIEQFDSNFDGNKYSLYKYIAG